MVSSYEIPYRRSFIMSSVVGRTNVDLYSLINLISTDDANMLIIYENFDEQGECGPLQTILYDGEVYDFKKENVENHLVGRFSFGENHEGDNRIVIYIFGSPEIV
jgi:hypothetical protein